MTIRIGILCPSNIAYRRFLPALNKHGGFTYVGVACANSAEWFGGHAAPEVLAAERKKAESFQELSGGEVFEGYKTLLERADVDAVYLPLPPALHYTWAKEALERGKHVFVEKPSTTSAAAAQIPRIACCFVCSSRRANTKQTASTGIWATLARYAISK